jgi:hypothetical protein
LAFGAKPGIIADGVVAAEESPPNSELSATPPSPAVSLEKKWRRVMKRGSMEADILREL